MCDQCQALMINGVLCHEQGCPIAWKDYNRECYECGCDFRPTERDQQVCLDCIEMHKEFVPYRPEDDLDLLDQMIEDGGALAEFEDWLDANMQDRAIDEIRLSEAFNEEF